MRKTTNINIRGVIMSKKINRNDPCWCGSGRKYKVCHEMFDDKIAKIAHQGHIVPTHNLIKNAEQIEKIKESAKINIAVLRFRKQFTKVCPPQRSIRLSTI